MVFIHSTSVTSISKINGLRSRNKIFLLIHHLLGHVCAEHFLQKSKIKKWNWFRGRRIFHCSKSTFFNTFHFPRWRHLHSIKWRKLRMKEVEDHFHQHYTRGRKMFYLEMISQTKENSRKCLQISFGRKWNHSGYKMAWKSVKHKHAIGFENIKFP